MKLVLAIAAVMSIEAADVGYIVGMYSAKQRPGIGGHFVMFIDGKKIARLRYPTYFRFEVPPGAYSVQMDDTRKPAILCHVIAGESCYVRARLTGKEDHRDVALISPHLAAVELGKLLPLEPEHVYIRARK